MQVWVFGLQVNIVYLTSGSYTKLPLPQLVRLSLLGQETFPSARFEAMQRKEAEGGIKVCSFQNLIKKGSKENSLFDPN